MSSKITRTRSCCCFIVPPQLLRHIAETGDASLRSRAIAAKTLSHCSAIHEARMSAHAGNNPNHSGSRVHGIVPPQVYQAIVDSNDATPQAKDRARNHLQNMGMIKDAKTEEGLTKKPIMQAKHLYRALYNSNETDSLPGTKLWLEGYTPKAKDDINATQVYAQFKQVFDFYYEVFGRNSIDDKGLNLVGSVHYDDDDGQTPGYDNAFWNGKEMAFGDGDGELFGSFTKNLDVTGHELTHGVTEKTANLAYEYEAGALNESISDVFGSMVKQYFAPGGKQKAKDADWLIGEGLWLVSNARALRDMANPGTAYDNSKIGKDPQPASMDDYQVSSNDEDGDWGGVHTNSGIPNRAFYLAATSIGEYSWDVAGKVWYVSLTDPSLRNVNSKKAFKVFADLTVKYGKEIAGDAGAAAMKKAWTTVKVY